MKCVRIAVCLMLCLSYVHATIEDDVKTRAENFEQAFVLFQRGEMAASADLLHEIALAAETPIIGRAEAADRLCDLVRYIAPQKDARKWADALLSIETSLKKDMSSLKQMKARERIQQSLARLTSTREHLIAMGKSGVASTKHLQEKLSKSRSLTKEDGAGLLDDIASVRDVSQRIPLAISVLKKIALHAELPDDVLELLAHGELAIRLREKNPIQAIKHYEKLMSLYGKMKPEAIHLIWGGEVANKIDTFVRHADNSIAASLWVAPKEKKAKDPKEFERLLDSFTSFVKRGDIESVKGLFHPDSPVLLTVLSILRDGGVVLMEYSDLQSPVLSGDGERVSVACVVRITKQVGEETLEKSGSKTVVFRKYEQKWLIDRL